MDFTISFPPDRSEMVIRTSGPATVQGFVDYMRARLEHPRWHEGMNLLIDHTDLGTSDIGREFIEELVKASEPFAESVGAGCIAVVVPGNASFGLARMFQGLAEGLLPVRYGLFRTVGEAESWLDAMRDAG